MSANVKWFFAVVCATLALGLLSGTATAAKQHRRSHRHEEGAVGDFDYYVLSLSWAPEFCATHGEDRTSRECDSSRHTGFIVHGLWPQKEDRRVEDCANVPPVSHSIVDLMLPLMYSAGLIQHEWRTHGSCTGLSPQDYFGMVRGDYQQVRIPREFRSPTPQQATVPAIQRSFAEASGLVGPDAVRVACSERGELSEVRLCFSKDGRSRPCTESVGECRSESVSILPVR